MKISEASALSGVSARSLRFYEKEGLIFAGREANSYRDYCRGTIERVLAIRSLLSAGLPVKLIKEVLPHLTDGERNDGIQQQCTQFLAHVEAYRDRLAARIVTLTAQQSALDAYLDRARGPGRD